MITKAQKKFLVNKIQNTIDDFIQTADYYAEEEEGYVNGLYGAIDIIKNL